MSPILLSARLMTRPKFTSGGGGGGGQLLLPSGNAVASNSIPLSFVNTHADANCQARAWHRNSYPGVPWDHMLGVHGGKFPYYVEILDGPSGLTVGDNLTLVGDVYEFGATYMRLALANPIAGSYTMSVRVTDQLGAQVTRTWTHVCSTTAFLFIDPVGGSNSNSGTIASPFLTDQALHGGSASSTTYAGKLVYVRTGTMILAGMGGSHYTFGGGPPETFVGFPGESPRIALRDRWLVCASGCEDTTIKGIEIFHDTVGWTAGTTDRKIISQINAHSRVQVVDCSFTNYATGSTSQNNPAVIATFDSVKSDLFYHNCEVTGDTGTFMNSFNDANVLLQKINVHNATLANGDTSSNAQVIRLKDRPSNYTIRLNEIWDTLTWSGNSSCCGIHGQDGANNIDICYNRFKHPALAGSATRNGAIFQWSGSPPVASVSNIHVYRNSLHQKARYEPDGDIPAGQEEWENNVIHLGAEPTSDGGLTNTGNVASGSHLDASVLLTGASRTSYLGTKGAEIAG